MYWRKNKKKNKNPKKKWKNLIEVKVKCVLSFLKMKFFENDNSNNIIDDNDDIIC